MADKPSRPSLGWVLLGVLALVLGLVLGFVMSFFGAPT